jgi:hypothetical protein
VCGESVLKRYQDEIAAAIDADFGGRSAGETKLIEVIGPFLQTNHALANAVANRTAVSSSIIGLNIANGASFWLRWLDSDVSPGADDGLALDNFSITASGAPGSLHRVGARSKQRPYRNSPASAGLVIAGTLSTGCSRGISDLRV